MMVERYTPKVNAAKELSEISKDFTSPKELARETISNSIDASASNIWIEATTDSTLGDEELVISITDDGVGMSRESLEGFFDLGYSSKREKKVAIGEKGHGTKIVYNSSNVTVFSRFIDNPQEVWKATMDNPRKDLNIAVTRNDDPPCIEFEQVEKSGYSNFDNSDSGTLIIVRGYDGNNWSAFSHGPLLDYIKWFTAWGGIDSAWGGQPNPPCKLFLKGLGINDFESVPYGHQFPEPNQDFRKLRSIDDRRPENYFVLRVTSDEIPVTDFPNKTLRIVFSVEGDSAKREYNQMLKRKGRLPSNPFPWESDRYGVSDRYGIYVCKNFIPIQRKNEKFSQKSEWTKWHAFINCESFSLTANRASVDNTDSKLLAAIYKTADEYIENYVFNSEAYLEFCYRMKMEEGRRKAEKERRELKKRRTNANSKKRYVIERDSKQLKIIEPRNEQEVVWLLSRLTLIWPELFPWSEVQDLDERLGYDMLVLQPNDLSGETEHVFVELKNVLRDSADFNHSFDSVSSIVCWNSKLKEDEEFFDIQKHRRIFKVSKSNAAKEFNSYYLWNPDGGVNIHVIVLSKYLKEVAQMKELVAPEKV